MQRITQAMIFAAGHGTRMGQYTRNTPKTLLHIGDKPLLDIIIDRLLEYGVRRIVVNVHYLAIQIINHLQSKNIVNCEIIISREKELLDTGGGLCNALSLLNTEALFTVNGDTIWYDDSLLTTLTRIWHEKLADITMVFYLAKKMAVQYTGEFTITSTGEVIRDIKKGKYIYAGIQIINPIVLTSIKKKIFSLSDLYLDLQDKNNTLNRVRGMVYCGRLFHVGTPEELYFTRSFNE